MVAGSQFATHIGNEDRRTTIEINKKYILNSQMSEEKSTSEQAADTGRNIIGIGETLGKLIMKMIEFLRLGSAEVLCWVETTERREMTLGKDTESDNMCGYTYGVLLILVGIFSIYCIYWWNSPYLYGRYPMMMQQPMMY